MVWRSPLLLAMLIGLCPAGIIGAQSSCRHGHTQLALTRCADEGARAEVARLDALLAQLYPKLDADRASALRQIQADWVRLRDAHCRWDAASYAGGSVMPMWYADCVGAATRARIDDLRFHLCNDDAGMAGECAASRAFGERPKKRSLHR